MFLDFTESTNTISEKGEWSWNVQRLSRKGVGAKRPRKGGDPNSAVVVGRAGRFTPKATTRWKISRSLAPRATRSSTSDRDIVRSPWRHGEVAQKRRNRNIQCCVHEHNPKIDGKFQNNFTCISGIHDDVVCCAKLGLQSRYYIGYLTIVDCSEWSDAKGNKHQFELRLIGAKLRTLKKFRRKKDDRGSLIGTMYRATRDDEKASSCGDEFEFQRAVDMDKMFPVVSYKGKKLTDMWLEAEGDAEKLVSLQRVFQIKPDANGKLPRIVPLFNYMEVLKPKSPAELRIMLGAAEVDDRQRGGGGQRGSRGGTTGEDQIPF